MRSTLLPSMATLASLLTLTQAHGNITSPPVRPPGAAMSAACGSRASASIQRDPTGPIENIGASSATCNLFLCKGTQFADNPTANIQSLTAGQVIPFRAALPIPHEGPANVSIVDTRTNSVIGQPLIVFDSYADEKLATLPANNTAFSVTMPQLQAGVCGQAGECVMQWFWFGTAAGQTYEDCVDFVAAGAAQAAPATPATGTKAVGC